MDRSLAGHGPRGLKGLGMTERSCIYPPVPPASEAAGLTPPGPLLDLLLPPPICHSPFSPFWPLDLKSYLDTLRLYEPVVILVKPWGREEGPGVSSSEEGQREGSGPGDEDMPAGPIWNPHTDWRGHGPIRNPHASGGVTGPSGTPMPPEGSHAHPELSPLLEESQAPACKTSWDHFPVILGLRE